MKKFFMIFLLTILVLGMIWSYSKYKFPNLQTIQTGVGVGDTDEFKFNYPVFEGWRVEYINKEKIIYKPSILYRIAHPLVEKVEIKIDFIAYFIAPDLSKYVANPFGVYYIRDGDGRTVEFYDNGGGIMFEQEIFMKNTIINSIFNLDTIIQSFQLLKSQ